MSNPLRPLLRPFYLRFIQLPKAQALLGRAYFRSRFAEWSRLNPPRTVFPHGNSNRFAVFEHVNSLLGTGPMLYLEFGVFSGASLRWWVENNSDQRSQFVGFDSFEGLPEDWNRHRPKGVFGRFGEPPRVDDARCSFEVGWFRETVPRFFRRLDRKNVPIVVHCDADLYSSTLIVLAQAVPYLRSGDMVLFDEFSDSMHEFRAFEDCFASYETTCEVLAATARLRQVAMQVR